MLELLLSEALVAGTGVAAPSWGLAVWGLLTVDVELAAAQLLPLLMLIVELSWQAAVVGRWTAYSVIYYCLLLRPVCYSSQPCCHLHQAAVTALNAVLVPCWCPVGWCHEVTRPPVLHKPTGHWCLWLLKL